MAQDGISCAPGAGPRSFTSRGKHYPSLKLLNGKLVPTVSRCDFDHIILNLSRRNVKRMSGPLVFQMCVILVLGSIATRVGGVQVSTPKVLRGNVRRDGETLIFHIYKAMNLLQTQASLLAYGSKSPVDTRGNIHFMQV